MILILNDINIYIFINCEFLMRRKEEMCHFKDFNNIMEHFVFYTGGIVLANSFVQLPLRKIYIGTSCDVLVNLLYFVLL